MTIEHLLGSAASPVVESEDRPGMEALRTGVTLRGVIYRGFMWPKLWSPPKNGKIKITDYQPSLFNKDLQIELHLLVSIDTPVVAFTWLLWRPPLCERSLID